MKKIVVIAAAIVAVVLFAHFYRLVAIGEIGFEAVALTGEDWIANLRSDNPDPDAEVIKPIFLGASDMLYERAGNLYAGGDKSRISSDFPIFVNGATAVMNLTDAAKLINEDFERFDSYYGLLLSDGHSYNYDNMTQADPDSFILIRMKSNIFSNMQEMAIEGENGYEYIPLNSLIFHTPESISYYAFEPSEDGRSGSFVLHRAEGLNKDSIVYFESKYYNYYDYLTKLGLYAELSGNRPPVVPGDTVGGEDELPTPEEEGVIKGEVVPIVPPIAPEPEFDIEGGGVAPIEDEEPLDLEGEGELPDSESAPGAPADPPVVDPNREVYRSPAVRLAKMRVDYNNTSGSGYTAEGRLSVLDRSLKLTGVIKIYLLSSAGSKLSEVSVQLPEGRDKERVYLSVSFSGLSLGSTYQVYGEYTYTDRDGNSQLVKFSEQEFEVKLPDIPQPLPPAGAAPSTPGKEVPPGYTFPSVTASALTGNVYSLHGTIDIKDPAHVMTKGVTFTIWDKDPGDQKSSDFPQNGAKTVRRVYIYNSGDMVLDPLEPGGEYWVTAEFSYKDPDNITLVNKTFFTKQQVFTLVRENNLANVNIAAEAGKLYPFQLELVNFGAVNPNSAQAYVTKYTKTVKLAFDGPGGARTFDLNAAQKSSVLSGVKTTYLSPAVFKSSSNYTYQASFYDVFGVDISEYYDEITGALKTCKSPPQANVSMTANRVAEFTTRISVVSTDGAPSQNYKIEVYGEDKETKLLTTIKRDGGAESTGYVHYLNYLNISDNEGDQENGTYSKRDGFVDQITFTDLPLGKALYLVVYADYDIADYKPDDPDIDINLGQPGDNGLKPKTEQPIGEYAFVTAGISTLGSVAFNVSYFTLDIDGRGADMDVKINTQNTNSLLRFLLQDVTLTFTPRNGGTVIKHTLAKDKDDLEEPGLYYNPDNIDFAKWKNGESSAWEVIWQDGTLWASDRSYKTGDYVYHKGTAYQANTDIAAKSAAPDANTAWTNIAAWNTSDSYGVNDLVEYRGKVYKATSSIAAAPAFDDSVWSISLRDLESATDYDITWSATVKLGDDAYIAATTGGRLSFKTTRRLPVIERVGEFITESTIDIRGIRVIDPDNVCAGTVQYYVAEKDTGKRVAGGTLKADGNGVNISVSGLTNDTTYEFSFAAPEYNLGFDSSTLMSQYTVINYVYNEIGPNGDRRGVHTQIEDKGLGYRDAAPFALTTRAGISGRLYLGGISGDGNMNGVEDVVAAYKAKFYVDLSDKKDEIGTKGGDLFHLRVFKYQYDTNMNISEIKVADVNKDFGDALASYTPARDASTGIDAYAVEVKQLAEKANYKAELYVIIEGYEKTISQIEFDTYGEVMEIRDIEDFALTSNASYKTSYSTAKATADERRFARYVVTNDLVLDPINYNTVDTALTAAMGLGYNVNAHGKPATNIGDFTDDKNPYLVASSDTLPFEGVIDFQGFTLTNNTQRGVFVWRLGAYAEIKNLVYDTSMFALENSISDHSRLTYYNAGSIHDIQVNIGQDIAEEHRTYVAVLAQYPKYSAASNYEKDKQVYFEGRVYKAKIDVPAASVGAVHLPGDVIYWEYDAAATRNAKHIMPETVGWNYEGGIIGRSNSGTVENFSVRVNQPVYARQSFGFIVQTNTGTIRNGYVYASPNMPKTYTRQSSDTDNDNDMPIVELIPGGGEQYAIQVSLAGAHQVDSQKGGSNVGGIAGLNEVNGVIENVYSTISILGVYDGDIHPSFNTYGTIAGANKGIMEDCYSTGVVAYRQSKVQTRETDKDKYWDGTWYNDVTEAGYANAWYYPGVYYAIGPNVTTTSSDGVPNNQDSVAYGPGIGQQSDKMKTSRVYYYSANADRKYTAIYNTRISVDMLRATSWQSMALGSGFDVAGTVAIGYYPHVIMDSSMPKQELMPLPFNTATTSSVVLTSAVVETQTEDYAVVAMTLKNPARLVIRDVKIKDDALKVAVLSAGGLSTHGRLSELGMTADSFGGGTRRQIDTEGITRVWVVLFHPQEPEDVWGVSDNGKRRDASIAARGAYLSQYTIDSVACTQNATLQYNNSWVDNQNCTVNAEFYQPINNALDWVRYVATDIGSTSAWTVKRNYRLKSDIDLSEAALKALTNDQTIVPNTNRKTLDILKAEKIFAFGTMTNYGDINTVANTTTRGTVVDKDGLPEFRVGTFTANTSSNHTFSGNLDGGKYDSARNLTGMYEIKNVTVNNVVGKTEGGGLLAFPAGRLTNLVLRDYTVNARGAQASGFAQSMGGGYIDNVHLYSATLTFTSDAATYNTYMGAIVGYLRYGEIYNSSVEGMLLESGSPFPNIGGLAGYTYFGRIENCYATDIDIKADNARGGLGIGGILGYGDQGIARNLYATGAITATDQYVGGIAGRLYVSQVVRNTWNTVDVTSMSDRVGGIVGGYLNNNPSALNSIAWGGVASAWSKYDPNDATAFIHRGAGDGQYVTRRASVNVYAWDGQMINGETPKDESGNVIAGDVYLLKVGVDGFNRNNTSDLRNLDTYTNVIKLGDAFIYFPLEGGAEGQLKEQMPQLKNTNGVYQPPQPIVLYPGISEEGVSARMLQYEAGNISGGGVVYDRLSLYIEHPEGTKLTDVAIEHVTTEVVTVTDGNITEVSGSIAGYTKPAGMVVSIIDLKVTGKKKYFDQYDVESASLKNSVTDAAYAPVPLDGKVSFTAISYREISSAEQWIADMQEYGHDYQNIKIVGTIDFAGLYGSKLNDGEMPDYNLYFNRFEGAEGAVIKNFISWKNVAQYTFSNAESMNNYFDENPDSFVTDAKVNVMNGVNPVPLYKCIGTTSTTPIPDFGTVNGKWEQVTEPNSKDGSGNIGGSLIGIVTASIKDITFENFAFATTGKSVGIVGRLMGSAENLKFKNVAIRKTGSPTMVGCFGGINGSAKNIYLENIYVEGIDYVGGFVGYSVKSTFDNIQGEDLNVLSYGHATNVNSRGGAYVGGLVGYGTSMDLINSKVHDAFVYGRTYVGGMSGYAHNAMPWGTTIMYGNDIQNAIVLSNGNSPGDAAHIGGLFGAGVVYEQLAVSNELVKSQAAPVGDVAKMTVTNPTNVTVIDHVFVIGGYRVGGMSGSPANQHTTRGVRVSNSRIFGGREVGGIIGRAEHIRDSFVTDTVVSSIYGTSRGNIDSMTGTGFNAWRINFMDHYWEASDAADKGQYVTRYNGGTINANVDTIDNLINFFINQGNLTTVNESYNYLIGGISGEYTVIGCGVANSFIGGASADYVGGITGRNLAYNSNSNYVLNTVVRGRDYVGGFSGQQLYGGTYINALNADVKGRNKVGGVTGDLNQNVTYYGSRTAFVRQTYFVGTVEATGKTFNTTGQDTNVADVYAGGISGAKADYDLHATTYISNVNLIAATIKVPTGANAVFLYHKRAGSTQPQIPGGDQYVYAGSQIVKGISTSTEANMFTPTDTEYRLTFDKNNSFEGDSGYQSMLVTSNDLQKVKWWGSNFRSVRTTAVNWNHFTTNYNTSSGIGQSSTNQYVHYRATGTSPNITVNNGYMPYLTKYGSSGSTATPTMLMINQQGRDGGTYSINGFNPYRKQSDVTGPNAALGDGYHGGILIPSGSVSAPVLTAMSMELTAIKLPLPVPTVYGAGGASGLNVEFDRADPDVGFYAKFDDEEPFAQSNIDKRTFTLDYRFDKAVIIVVTDGERTEKYRFEPDALKRTVMLWGDNFYFITQPGVREKEGKMLPGEFTNLRDGGAVTASGALYDAVSGRLLTESVAPGLRDETSPIYSFSYDGFNLDVFKNYTVSRAPDGSETELEMPLIVKNGALTILDASLPVQYDGLVFDAADGEEYLSFLEDSGRISDTRAALKLPADFRNYGIVHMTNNLNSDLPYILVRYDTGHALGFNYLTGERLDLSVGNSDASLFEFAKGYVSNPGALLGSLADGYLKMTELREVLTLQSLTDEMLALQGPGETGEADAAGTAEGSGDGANGENKDVAGENDALGALGTLTDGGTGTEVGTASGDGENPNGAAGQAVGDQTGALTDGDKPSGDGDSLTDGKSDDGGEGEGRNQAPSDGEGAPADGETGEYTGESGSAELAEEKDAAAEDGRDAAEKPAAKAGEGENEDAPEADDKEGAASDNRDGETAENIEGETDAEADAGDDVGIAGEISSLVKTEPIPARTFTMAYDSESGQYVFYDVAQLLRGETVPAITATEENLALAAQLLENHRTLESGRSRELPVGGKFVIVIVSVAIVVLLVIIFDKRRRTW